MDKKRLRSQYRQARRGLSAPPADELAQQILDVIPENAKTGAAYLSFGDELDLRPALVRIPHITWCYPRVDGEDLQFFISPKLSGLPQNKWGIEEPDPAQSQEVLLENCDFILVPGVSFDQQGGRLGSGAGFYDRALKSFTGLKIGVAFAAQVSDEELPREDHDVRMDIVVTEEFILRPMH